MRASLHLIISKQSENNTYLQSPAFSGRNRCTSDASVASGNVNRWLYIGQCHDALSFSIQAPQFTRSCASRTTPITLRKIEPTHIIYCRSMMCLLPFTITICFPLGSYLALTMRKQNPFNYYRVLLFTFLFIFTISCHVNRIAIICSAVFKIVLVYMLE